MSAHNTLRGVGLGLSLAVASSPAIASGAEQAPNSLSPSAEVASIENALNGHNHVAHNVVVDQGFQVPLPRKSYDSPVGVISPIDLGHDYYAYVSSSLENSHVTLSTIKYSGKLAVSTGLHYSHTKEFFHRVTEPIALVYDDIPTNGGGSERSYTVTAGSVSGNVNKIMQIYPGAGSDLTSERESQLAEIYGNQIAQPLYEGK